METIRVKTAVIGGGASGLCAAICCGESHGKSKTIILERQSKTGRKLLATGNGRCNISNRNVNISHYHGDKKIIGSVLSQFTPKDCERFFMQLGVILREDSEGRLYPYSNQASTILDSMRSACRRLGLKEICGFDIRSIERKNELFIINSDNMRVSADNLIIAAGTGATPSLGSDESGFNLLEKMGIRVSSPLFPALCPVSTKERYKMLKGVRAKGSVVLKADDHPAARTKGEIQFTDSGLSGICIFDLSRYVNEYYTSGTVSGKRSRQIKISLDLVTEYSRDELTAYLTECRKLYKDESADMLLSGVLNNKLSQAIARYCRVSGKQCSGLSRNDISLLADAAKGFVFTPDGLSDYRSAQVCAGGIGSDQADPDTLMSRKIRNLFIIGEMLDCDGECGGYNLHFALGSAVLAAGTINRRN